jgi:hypothetical protein
VSTEIVARFHFDEHRRPADELLCRMARTFSEWPQTSNEFRGLKVSKMNRQTIAAREEGTLNADGLCKTAAGQRHPSGLLSTTSSFRCWRFPNGHPEAGSVGVWLEAWGDDWTLRHYEDHRIGGEASLAVFDVGPFCALTEAATRPQRDEVNASVEENLDALTGLLFRLIEALEPRSVKVYTDLSLYLPHNAHLLYFRDEGVVLDDLALIAQVWERGLPAHRTGPLRDCRPEDMSAGLPRMARSSPARTAATRIRNAAASKEGTDDGRRAKGARERPIRYIHHVRGRDGDRIPSLPERVRRRFLSRGAGQRMRIGHAIALSCDSFKELVE